MGPLFSSQVRVWGQNLAGYSEKKTTVDIYNTIKDCKKAGRRLCDEFLQKGGWQFSGTKY
jgi:hypothetical protein